MFEFVAGIFALGLVAQIAFWIVAVAVFPVFWIWMLVDAALRPEAEYPSAGSSEKIVWIVLMLLFQITSIAYFVMVYRKAARRTDEAATAVEVTPPAPPIAPAASAGM